MLNEGDIVPDLMLQSADGSPLPLAMLRGKPFVLYFYPKDDTSGCTREAQDFSHLKAAFDMEGVGILGVSRGTAAGKAKFIDKYDFRIPLANDEGAVSEAFGVWGEKSMYGRKYMGLDRATFLIDGAGRIVRAWRKVKVPGHADAVLIAARALATSEANPGV